MIKTLTDTNYLSLCCYSYCNWFATSSIENSLASFLSNFESADSHLGDVKDPEIVGDGANTHHDLLSIAISLDVASKTSNGERWSVDLTHEQPLEDDLVELSLGPPGQEPVELHQQPQVDVLALGFSSANLAILVVADINTHGF